jgi:serine phosphatase RsbU (regulator of sigma subunit)
MNFFRKSIVARLFMYFFILGASIAFGGFALYSTDTQNIPLAVFIGSLLFFLIIFLFIYFFDIGRPLGTVLNQMKALLTGRKYTRLYSRRLDEIGVIAHFFNEVTKSFEKASSDIKEGKRMMNELEVAAQIQKDIMPPANPKIPGLDVVAKTRSAAELGGDNFDFITIGDNTYIYIGDVTGHGVPAAIVMTMVHTILHALADYCPNAYEIIVKTNTLLKKSIKSTMFMTMLFYHWDHLAKKMSYVGAGHEHVLVYRAGMGRCEVKPTGGIALGMVPDNSKLTKEIDLPLDVDDVIVLYTDGITEGRNMAGEMYTLDRLVKAVEQFAPEYSSEGIVNHVAIDYSKFVENHVQDDDVSLIAIKYVGEGKEKDNSQLNIAISSWNPDDDSSGKKVDATA